MNEPFQLLHFYVSPGHNYFGHHSQASDRHPIDEAPTIRCVAARGIEGDRFFEYKDDYKGQITFFAVEVYESLCKQFEVWDKPASVFRRNVITRGVELITLIGREFEIQGVRFFGTEECRPCHWMDQAFCCGAEAAMSGRGGLRARILTTGVLRSGTPGGSRPVPAARTFTWVSPGSSH